VQRTCQSSSYCLRVHADAASGLAARARPIAQRGCAASWQKEEDKTRSLSSGMERVAP
jgi:hypothetical protein